MRSGGPPPRCPWPPNSQDCWTDDLKGQFCPNPITKSKKKISLFVIDLGPSYRSLSSRLFWDYFLFADRSRHIIMSYYNQEGNLLRQKILRAWLDTKNCRLAVFRRHCSLCQLGIPFDAHQLKEMGVRLFTSQYHIHTFHLRTLFYLVLTPTTIPITLTLFSYASCSKVAQGTISSAILCPLVGSKVPAGTAIILWVHLHAP